MAETGKILAIGTLNSTLTTVLYTVPNNTVARITHLTISNGSTAGTITLSIEDTSASTTANIFNAKAITANDLLEFFDAILEAGDKIKGGATTTTGAQYIIFGIEST